METRRNCLGIFAFIWFAVITFYCKSATACSCMPSHPQTLYCEADYAVVVRVLRMSYRSFENNMIYKIQIKKSFKTTPEGDMILRHHRLLTPSHDATCGVKLGIGKLYVIAGRGRHLNSCSYIQEYQKMTVVERMGFSRLYRKGCDKCKIKACFHKYCSPNDTDKTVCQWSPFDECEKNFSACLKRTSYKERVDRDQYGRCYWKKSPVYNKCKAEQT
uniref:NTR domain-containing protein n=1 Tax=Glossina morsitans morsitans TaxID=37546 RepID=A0A1B0FH08_GLOMM